MASARFVWLLRAQGIYIGYWEGIKLTYAGNFFNFVMVGTTGGDLFKAFYVAQHTRYKLEAVTTIFLDRVVGLELGADDYICKPFSPREVVARVKAVLRRMERAEHAKVGEVLAIGDLVIDGGRRAVEVAGETVELTRTEFDLLATLAAHPGRVYTRMQLMEAAQGDAFEGYERTIDAHVKNVRRKLGDDPRNPRYVQTVFGVGYKLEERA